MRIALIGMSGAGKSFWSGILARHGFEVFGCDDDIGRRLAATGEIADPSLDHLGRWMGFPFEPGFARRQALYLSLEHTVMDDLLTSLEAAPLAAEAPPLVIDTSGSVVYAGQAMMQRLRRQSVVVYLSLSPVHRDALRRAYEKNPRPVIWQQHYWRNTGETDREALKRSYANLTADRDSLYRRYAHLEIQWEPTSAPTPSADTLLGPAISFLNQRRPPHGV